MSKVKFLLCIVVASMALASCTKDDNPTGTPTYNVEDPQEEVTDQPAYGRIK